jgi:hypothetical protein
MRNVADLLPINFQNLFSGHHFPVSEAHEEFGRSIALVRIGYYQYAIFGLRWALELGFLSVYWDRNDDAGTAIKAWLRSEQQTPFKKKVIAGLLSVDNIRTYADHSGFLDEFELVYGELSNYAHVKGVRYSSHAAYRGNVIQFSERSFRKWAAIRRRVAKLVTAVHLMKYPVGLQHTPLFEKFGLNPPAGGFLEPGQAEQISELFSPTEWELLKSISDADVNAVGLAEWVASHPDTSEDAVIEQSHAMDRDMVRNQGYSSWYAMHSQMYPPGSAGRARFIAWAEDLRQWAGAQGWIEYGEHGPFPPRKPFRAE